MSTIPSANQVIKLLESWSPQRFAMESDRVGLMLGSLERPVKKVLVTLDVTEAVVQEAIEQDIDLIISHHPLLFKPLTEVDTDTAKGQVIQKCLQHEITVYAAHTNLDIAPGGVNDWIAEAIGLENTSVLVPQKTDALQKLVAFVPEENVEYVRKALGDAGAGHIGDYSHCTFNSDGTGTFIPGDGTDPHIGNRGEMTFVSEKKIETVVPDSKLAHVLNVLTDVHPYEEPAYDLYPLGLEGESIGLGRIGELPEGMPLETFAHALKDVFAVDGLRVSGDLGKTVKNVAVLGGAGEKYWPQALKAGADVYVTGDLTYHNAQDAQAEGLSLVDPGHHIEEIMKKSLASRLTNEADSANVQVSFKASAVSTEPFRFL
ncbi:dinuclear metal center YbgI/SA1388 family protein [Geomicrobium halophilum]|uniref:GTP cyclohydrolase 1 type 2 homolog n=1 Tax=Geomicrobium halophilum TaxID=549000 RepID=A0A841PJF3_9BACL|nr:Nif3-like dinuclear metal center hexameric protein [Geomicrobium halophilum]MBB6448849.1 dinuclear metal center YbgI/SA1388 family protein [Geomicrobium halophilum]